MCHFNNKLSSLVFVLFDLLTPCQTSKTITSEILWFIALVVYALKGNTVAKSNTPAGMQNPEKCTSICPLSAVTLQRKYSQCLRVELKIMSRPLQKMFNTNIQAPGPNAKISHKKSLWRPGPVREHKVWEICSRGKYSKTAQYNYSVCMDLFKCVMKRAGSECKTSPSPFTQSEWFMRCSFWLKKASGPCQSWQIFFVI